MRADALRAMDDAALKDALLSLYGVGEKVAQCVMLFGFHRMNAFPVDVWMGRVRDLRSDARSASLARGLRSVVRSLG